MATSSADSDRQIATTDREGNIYTLDGELIGHLEAAGVVPKDGAGMPDTFAELLQDRTSETAGEGSEVIRSAGGETWQLWVRKLTSILRTANRQYRSARTRTKPRWPRISASNVARDRNSPIREHQVNLQRSLIGSEYRRFAIAVSRLGFAVGTGRPQRR